MLPCYGRSPQRPALACHMKVLEAAQTREQCAVAFAFAFTSTSTSATTSAPRRPGFCAESAGRPADSLRQRQIRRRHSPSNIIPSGPDPYVKACKFQQKQDKNTNSLASSPQANYTELAIAAGRRILVPTFADIVLSRGERDGYPRPLVSVF
jgi:hypothetical protein